MSLNLVLASASPRRSQLLGVFGLPFAISASAVDEEMLGANYRGSPYSLACWLAEYKAHDVAAAGQNAPRFILAADTTVIFQGRILGKPADAAVAVAMLRELRGHAHDVVTGVVLLESRAGAHSPSALWQAQACTAVTMRNYTAAEIASYVASGDPLDKAGAYAIQQEAFHPVEQIAGCYPNVMGLPICLVALLLARAGITPPTRPGVGHCGWSGRCTLPLPDGLRQYGDAALP